MEAGGSHEFLQTPRRLRYKRDTILAIKEHSQVSDLNVDDNLLRVSSVAQRIGRLKSKGGQGKASCERSRDAGAIVLGPQKRTWNTGCHVSMVRDSIDNGFARSGKLTSESRGKDRQSYRPSADKTESRGTGRDRGVRRNDGHFPRARFRDERHGESRPGHYEEEPEWFSGGPTNVNETIELGRVLEDDECENSGEINLYASPVTHAVVSKENEESTVTVVSEVHQTQPMDTGSFPSGDPDAAPTNADAESQGSRFRHLFPKVDATTKRTNDINTQLLELLRGSSASSVPTSEKQNGLFQGPDSSAHSVLQVESKLRSLLLGHRSQRTADHSQKNSALQNHVFSTSGDVAETKPKILTVEEIEAQLDLSTNSQPAVAVAQSQDDTKQSSLTRPDYQTNAPNVTSVPNASLRQHQTVCTKQLQLHGPLGPFGMLSNPMIRLPPTTNAMSASARINQLQQLDLPASDGPSDSSHQGIIATAWDSQGIASKSAINSLLQPISTNSFRQNCVGASPPLNEFNYRSGTVLNPLTGPNMGAVSAPRRPIVKAQQGGPMAHGMLSRDVGFLNGATAFSGPMRDMDRRLVDFPARSQFQTPAEALNSGDKPQFNTIFATGGDFCRSNLDTHHFTQSLNPLVASNNNNTVDSTYQPAKPPSESTLAFLTQLVEMDRSSVSSLGYPKTSVAFNHLITAGIKAKTLEEIEH